MNAMISTLKKINRHNKHHVSDTFWLGCLIGGILFIMIYGIRVLDVTYDAWLLDSTRTEDLWDLTQHYLGWISYRNTPWQFPLGLTEGIFSSPVSVIYTDSIPLFAFIFKLLSPILPETFQYFGIFELLCHMLMGGFSALLTRAFTDNLFLNSISAAFFVLSPVMLKRTFYHTALSAHFLIPAAFCLWIYYTRLRETKSNRQILCYWTILSVISLLINAYFTPMVLGIYLCFLLQKNIVRSEWKRLPADLLVPLAFTGFFGWIMGLFYGNVSASSERLTDLSHNLNGWFNPGNYLLEIKDINFIFSPQNYSSFLPALSDMTPWQQEGFSYLGLGMILLLAVLAVLAILFCITLVRSILRQKSHRPIQPIQRVTVSWIISVSLCLLVFLFLALSPRATLGDHVIYEIDYPDVIYRLLSVFRSTGRLIWPVYYGVMALILIGLIRLLSGKAAGHRFLVVLFSGALLLQTVDLMPALEFKHEAYTTEYDDPQLPFVSPAWEILGENSTRIMFCNPTSWYIQCNPEFPCPFWEYALSYDLSLNVTYMSRDMTSLADQETKKHFQQRAAGASYPDIIYVFYKPSKIPSSEATHLNYYEIDGYFIGTEMDLSGITGVSPLSL